MKSSSLDLPIYVRTCAVNGFILDGARRSPGNVVLELHKYDSFGVRVDYAIAIFRDEPTQAALSGISKSAEFKRQQLVIISPVGGDPPHLTPQQFFTILGGPVDYSDLLDPALPELLEHLGFNRLPKGLEGDPEDLLESYVRICLQYLLGRRAHRWGIARRFEALPDGLAFGPDGLMLLFDAKSYADGFPIDAKVMRAFQEYVDNFHEKYEDLLGRLHSFLLISGKFTQQPAQLAQRSSELYSKSRVPICFLTSRALGEMVQLLLKSPRLRHSIDWRSIFSQPVADSSYLEKQIKALMKDSLIEGS